MADETEPFDDPTIVGDEDDDDPVIDARAADAAAFPDPAAQAVIQAGNVANAANPVAGPPVQGVQAPNRFALTPGLHHIATAIDYGSRSGIILYQRGSSALVPPFSGETDGVTIFTERLFDRASEMGWNHPHADILTIDTVRNGQHVPFDLIQEFGMITMQEVLDQVMTYSGTQTRRAQNAVMMYHCIMETLTEEAHSRIVTETNRYIINGVPNGPLLFRYLLHTITIDTRATTTYIRLNMSNLDSYISVIDHDIEKFNLYVKEQRRQLKNRGEESQDLLINVFKAYLSVNDKYFVDYINRKKETYEEGGDITVDSILSDALNKFQSLKNEGLWQSKVKEDKIVALTAQFHEMKNTLLKDKNLRLSDKIKSKPNKNGKSFKKKSKSKEARKKEIEQLEAWKKVAPKAGEPQTKVHSNGKTYHWCEDHMTWCIHLPADCDIRKKRLAAQAAKNKSNNNNLAASFASILADEE